MCYGSVRSLAGPARPDDRFLRVGSFTRAAPSVRRRRHTVLPASMPTAWAELAGRRWFEGYPLPAAINPQDLVHHPPMLRHGRVQFGSAASRRPIPPDALKVGFAGPVGWRVRIERAGPAFAAVDFSAGVGVNRSVLVQD